MITNKWSTISFNLLGRYEAA